MRWKLGVTAIGVLAIALTSTWNGRAGAQPMGVQPGVIQQELRPSPTPPATAPIDLPRPTMPLLPSGAETTKFELVQLDIEGATVFSQDQLLALTRPFLGKTVSMADIFGIARAITRLYMDSGYPLSVAYVPAQQISEGRLKIVVVEGYIAEVEITGNAGRATEALHALGAKLKRSRPLKQSALERYLLLANDLPGLTVRGVIDQATAERGAVKLIMVASRKNGALRAGFNNRGSSALGRERAVLNWSEFGGLNGRDRIDINFVRAFDSNELSFIHGHVETTLGAQGMSVALDGMWSDSEPGVAALKAARFNSDGMTVSLEVRRPLVRSRARNIIASEALEVSQLRGRFEALPNAWDNLRVLRSKIFVGFNHPLGAVTQSEIVLSRGLDVFGATKESQPLKSRPNGSADFASASGTLSHYRPFSGFDLLLSLRTQIASRALLVSEECGYGGGAFGRAFDNYEISGESCVLGLAELQRALGPSRKAYVFYDAGMVRQKDVLMPGENRRESGKSIGAGLRFNLGRHIAGSIEFAQPLNRIIALEGNERGRVFVSIALTP